MPQSKFLIDFEKFLKVISVGGVIQLLKGRIYLRIYLSLDCYEILYGVNSYSRILGIAFRVANELGHRILILKGLNKLEVFIKKIKRG